MPLRTFDLQYNKKSTKKNAPWVDVDDNTPESRKRPPQQNGFAVNGRGHQHANGRLTKKQKLTNGNAQHHVNGVAKSPGTSTNLSASGIQEQRNNLPIAQGRDALIEEIKQNDVTVLLGETGSGKTTQVPQYLLESGIAGTGIIAVTQPRKVAATSLASRVATECGVEVGSTVGYAVRFDERAGPKTRIKYMTDGMIVRELLSDPMLSKYSVIIVDEAHERTLRTDLLMANLKTILQARNGGIDAKGKGKEKAEVTNPLKVIIMSATLDAEKFSKFFLGAKILYVKGRQHPVTIYHTSLGQNDYVDAAMRVFFQIHTDQPSGDVLIFLPGQEDIESLEKSIQLFSRQLPHGKPDVHICSMYASQAPKQNAKAFAPTPPNTRKCILATNIAETSITIPGVKYVIDTGKCKEKRYLARDLGSGLDTLMTVDVSQSSAMQRAGRAGREGQGYCYRLYTEASFKNMLPTTEPEILRCSLTASFLQLKCLGQDLQELDLMDQPDTETSRQMASLPLDPIHACAVIKSKEHGCTNEILDIVSVLSASSKLFFDVSEQRDAVGDARRKFRHPSGDHMTTLNVVHAFADLSASEGKATRREWCRKHYLNERTLLEARDIKLQLEQACSRLDIDPSTRSGNNEEVIIKSLTPGLVTNSALLQPDGTYKQTIGQSIVKIHPGSTLAGQKHPAIIYDELTFTNQIYARGVSAVQKNNIYSLPSLSVRKA